MVEFFFNSGSTLDFSLFHCLINPRC